MSSRSGNGPGPASSRRVVPGDRDVRGEEPGAAGEPVHPTQQPAHSRRLVDPEARLVVPADVARVFEHVETAVANDRLHPEVAEPAGVEQGRAVAAAAEDGGEGRRGDRLVLFRPRVDGGVARTQHREHPLDALGVDGVGVLEQHPLAGERGEVRHRILGRPVGAEVMRRGGFEQHDHHVPVRRGTAEAGEVVGRERRGDGVRDRVALTGRFDARDQTGHQCEDGVAMPTLRLDPGGRQRSERDDRDRRNDSNEDVPRSGVAKESGEYGGRREHQDRQREIGERGIVRDRVRQRRTRGP